MSYAQIERTVEAIIILLFMLAVLLPFMLLRYLWRLADIGD